MSRIESVTLPVQFSLPSEYAKHLFSLPRTPAFKPELHQPSGPSRVHQVAAQHDPTLVDTSRFNHVSGPPLNRELRAAWLTLRVTHAFMPFDHVLFLLEVRLTPLRCWTAHNIWFCSVFMVPRDYAWLLDKAFPFLRLRAVLQYQLRPGGVLDRWLFAPHNGILYRKTKASWEASVPDMF